MDERGRLRLRGEGFAANVIEEYIPTLECVALSADPANLSEGIRAFFGYCGAT